MIRNYLSKEILISLSVIGGCALIVSIIRPKRRLRVTEKNCVFITGCDSGLGLTLAIKCHELGLFVIAGCLNVESDGAKKLTSYANNRMIVAEVDIRNNGSIKAAGDKVSDLLIRNGLNFTALINNAGIMVLGEFEWQTMAMIESQIEVNLIGTMKLTKQFLPMCRQYNARIIVVTSHCSLQALPSISPYGASKGGLGFFVDALRVEMKKYQVDVVNFIPGSFIMQSNIFARQQEYSQEMRKQMTDEQLQFYGDYFNEFNNYLLQLDQYRKPGLIGDVALLNLFERALLEVNPRSIYINQNWRYAAYHFLCGISPVCIRDWLIVRFMTMPTYKPTAKK
ncbi:D-beta-hydroxybutyrate dehydrogenase, mitochondrial [Bradysia coprophila]|uniref:D-beta-hydroxybutyrate dehydrogenase, mitochondrial n=1 Tax=Bradysia coprophila TaxID=38358 RepID=UPI00187D7E31|nr:D-beta-hydroxybutyrate dehydrogenase, mitochondrial [Bradysia coprophila]